MQWLKKLFQHGNGRHLARPAEAKNRAGRNVPARPDSRSTGLRVDLPG